ncbi:MAG: LPXTG cell wall anchor domain-containing protein [Bryobacteraceae bacterium]
MPFAVLVALALVVLTPLVNADVWNKKTIVTFPDSVELPGQVTLPAGTYVMKLLDSPSNRHIVQVMNRDENKVFATILAISAQRMEPADKTVITFYETPREYPRFIRTWFYPGDTIGQEFAYTKERAQFIASISGKQPPLSTTEQTTVAQSVMPRQEVELTPAPAPAVEEAPAPGVGAEETPSPALEEEASPAPSVEPEPEPQAQDPAATKPQDPAATKPVPAETLPATGTSLPLFAATGLTLAALAGLTRLYRKMKR